MPSDSVVAPRRPDPNVLRALKYLRTTYESIHTDSLRNTERGHWINEAFVVRLFAVLEAYGFARDAASIDFSIPGADKVDLCRRLRHKIAHSTARITGQEARRLDKRVREVFGLGDQDTVVSDTYILSKDTVLRPMHDACSAYCEEILARHAA